MEVFIIAIAMLIYIGIGGLVGRSSPEVFLYFVGSILYTSIAFYMACVLFGLVALVKRQQVLTSLFKLLVASVVAVFPAAVVPNFLPI
ncbi:hypothetical protein DFR28_1037 [Arenicella xantha]|uniref:Uncharacterized protein n=2 Tax=Arenicella xantha TaxID=644221 RepID=A0A395JKJ7_9GAMM|nr:hypothetical protein DFR28_1037 [Arenicella xantha]